MAVRGERRGGVRSNGLLVWGFLIGVGFPFGGDENVLELDRGVAVQHCECLRSH